MSHSPLKSSRDRPTPTVEDYLMSMHVLERDQGEIVAARLAEILNVAAPTVTMTLKRMERDQWITRRGPHGGVRLTATGRAAAHSVVRRHMLTEWLLLKVLKLPFVQIHDEAHALEHAISPSLEERLVDILGNPHVCPHGNPFPGFEDETGSYVPLTRMAVGERFIFRRLHEFAEGNRELVKYLLDNGIANGVEAVLLEVLPFNQTLVVQVEGRAVVLGFSAAQALYGETR